MFDALRVFKLVSLEVFVFIRKTNMIIPEGQDEGDCKEIL